ncbi:uncharacterized protein [Euphorbia lathyris]|uniref:uncharacterized protein isoform X2 n=1 Tax=Euphorbia lathyris TaxID=212925 RepID=UPI0033144DE5
MELGLRPAISHFISHNFGCSALSFTLRVLVKIVSSGSYVSNFFKVFRATAQARKKPAGSFGALLEAECQELLVSFTGALVIDLIHVLIHGIVTRCPLILQLYKSDEGNIEYAEFLHLPRKQLTILAT